MGVKDLKPFLKEFGIEPQMFVPVENAKINIDACLFFFKHLGVYTAKFGRDVIVPPPNYGVNFFDDNGLPNYDFFFGRYNSPETEIEAIYAKARDNILQGFLRMMISLYQNNFQPVLVWDSWVGGVKSKLTKLGEKKPPCALSLNMADIIYISIYLEAAGFPTKFADDQGEKSCVELEHDYVYTEDTDVIILGANCMLTEITFNEFSGPIFTGFHIAEILKKMSEYLGRPINLQHLQIIASYLGSDFNLRVPRVGPKTLLKMFQGGGPGEVPPVSQDFVEFFCNVNRGKSCDRMPNLLQMKDFAAGNSYMIGIIKNAASIIENPKQKFKKRDVETVNKAQEFDAE